VVQKSTSLASTTVEEPSFHRRLDSSRDYAVEGVKSPPLEVVAVQQIQE